MVKCIQKVLRYLNTIVFVVKHLRVVSKCCSNWIFFMMASLLY